MQAGNDRYQELTRQISRLKREKNAVVLVHNYQRPEIYRIADHIGDSLELARRAAETDADIIVFCGVHFMAETAKILNPEKTVLLPTLAASCSLAEMATAGAVEQMKKKYPGAAVVSYVNTTAEVKAVSDVCCTSANAVRIVNALPQEEVIFLPDKNLGRYVQTKTKKKIHLWEGYCAVHQELNGETLLAFKRNHPLTKIIAHPECRRDILNAADHVCGTGGVAAFASHDNSADYVVVTECGMVNKLREDVPEKAFFSFCNFCTYMKATTLEMVAHSLYNEKNKIELPDDVMRRARKSIVRMLEAA